MPNGPLSNRAERLVGDGEFQRYASCQNPPPGSRPYSRTASSATRMICETVDVRELGALDQESNCGARLLALEKDFRGWRHCFARKSRDHQGFGSSKIDKYSQPQTD